MTVIRAAKSELVIFFLVGFRVLVSKNFKIGVDLVCFDFTSD